jgi:plasminogen activator inhibitor 1 RNA-binding protein
VSHGVANAAEADRETSKEDNRGGNRNRERHGARAGRGEGEGERRPKREFDRRSGTGRGREVSRGGRGAFGAGNPAQDALDAEKNPKAAAEGAVDGVADAAEEDAAPVEEQAPAEPEPVTFTLDEFMRKREEARQKVADLAAVAARTVNRETEFAGMTTLATALDDYVGANVAKAEAGRKDQRSTGKTQVLDVGFKFPTVQPEREGGRGGRGEGGRGGRGGDREGGRGGRREGRGEGRGAPRAPRSNAAFNAADFPSL